MELLHQRGTSSLSLRNLFFRKAHIGDFPRLAFMVPGTRNNVKHFPRVNPIQSLRRLGASEPVSKMAILCQPPKACPQPYTRQEPKTQASDPPKAVADFRTCLFSAFLRPVLVLAVPGEGMDLWDVLKAAAWFAPCTRRGHGCRIANATFRQHPPQPGSCRTEQSDGAAIG
jgi:hypothetical protein